MSTVWWEGERLSIPTLQSGQAGPCLESHLRAAAPRQAPADCLEELTGQPHLGPGLGHLKHQDFNNAEMVGEFDIDIDMEEEDSDHPDPSPEHFSRWRAAKQQLPAVRSSVSSVLAPAQRLVTVVRQVQPVPGVVSLLTELAEDQHLQLSLLPQHGQQGGGYSAARQKDLRTNNDERILH